MRSRSLAAAVLCLTACSPQDLAGVQPPPRAAVNELSHSVGVRFERGLALLTVSRQLRNDTLEYQTLSHPLTLPQGAIATALRIGADQRWQTETLLSAEDAKARWTALTAPGEAAPSTLGLLEWVEQTELRLTLFGIAPGATVDVELDLEVPPAWVDGSWQFDYPLASGDWTATPRFHFPRAPEAKAIEVRDEPVENGGAVTGFRVLQPRATIDEAELHWATYPLAADRTLWRLEIDAATLLEAAPAHPNVVFVIDGSHSEGAEGIAAQLELLPGYLANVPDAQVEVVVYRRFAERLFGRFVPAAEVPGRLAREAGRLFPANGSNLELGARLAARALREAAGTGRIVIFTDELLREGFSNQAAITELAEAPTGTVVHVVARTSSGGELSEQRDDGAELAPVASANGGIFLRVDGHPEDPELAAKTLLGLVRPVRIDGFAVSAPGMTGDQLDVPSPLLEGATVRQMAIAEHPPQQLTVTGKIWAREFRRVVSLDYDLGDRMPGLAIGSDEVRGQLQDDELRTAAVAAHAVSPVTSYLSAPSDAAPSTIGVEIGELFGLSGFGTCGCGGFSSRSHCGIRMETGHRPDYEAELRRLLAPGVAACAAQYGKSPVAVSLEATGDEVVAVESTGSNASMASCVTEAAWAIRLTSIFGAHRTYRVELSAE